MAILWHLTDRLQVVELTVVAPVVIGERGVVLLLDVTKGII